MPEEVGEQAGAGVAARYHKRLKEIKDLLADKQMRATTKGCECYYAALRLFRTFYGPESAEEKRLLELGVDILQHPNSNNEFLGMLENLDLELERGLAGDLSANISAEVLGDFLQLARQALEDNHVNVAAVLAAAALEDAFKRKVEQLGGSVEGKTLSDTKNFLKSKGVFSGAQRQLVDGYPTFRDKALHADWGKVQSEYVGSVLGFLQTFLRSQSGPGGERGSGDETEEKRAEGRKRGLLAGILDGLAGLRKQPRDFEAHLRIVYEGAEGAFRRS